MNQGDGRHSSGSQNTVGANPCSTVVVFGIMLMVVDITSAINCQPMSGFIPIPLVSNVGLWNSKNAEQWKSELGNSYAGRAIYGLSSSGELMTLRHNEAGIRSSVTEWDEWVSGVGEIGNLVMIAGGLLRAGNPYWYLYT